MGEARGYVNGYLTRSGSSFSVVTPCTHGLSVRTLARPIAALVGASGLVGSACLQGLARTQDFSQIVTLGRSPLRNAHHIDGNAAPLQSPKHEHRIVDFDSEESLAAALGATTLFVCLGTTLRKAGSRERFRDIEVDMTLRVVRSAQARGCAQVLLVSSVGADPEARSFYLRVKGEVERAVSQLGFESAHLFRPSLLSGERTEFRPGERAALFVGKVLRPVMLGPLARYRPISARAVAEAMIAVACKGQPGVHVYESEQIGRLR